MGSTFPAIEILLFQTELHYGCRLILSPGLRIVDGTQACLVNPGNVVFKLKTVC